MASSNFEKSAMVETADPDTMASEKETSPNLKSSDSTTSDHTAAYDEKTNPLSQADAIDKDLEAQHDDAQLEPVQTTASHRSHRSALSRLSKKKTKEQVPAPTIPVMDLDNGVVGWEGQDDPLMPLNFAPRRKWVFVFLLALITLMTPFASSILAPALQSYADAFHEHGLTKPSLAVTIFLLGYAVGPLFLSPLSEIYGRNIILISANAFFAVWLIGCALAPSLDTLIFFRFMCGLGGSACQTIGGAVIADLFPVAERGRAMTFWMLGPLFGPSLAPVIGGFLSETIGWRWTSWITFIPTAVVVVSMVIFFRETNHRVLILRKTERLRKELNRPELRSCYIDPEKPVQTSRQLIQRGLTRPFIMLFKSVIVFSASLYIAFAYGCLYLLFNTIPIVYQGQYHWNIGITGLVYLSLLIGYAVGLALFSALSDKTVVRMTKANNGVYEPEMRLPYCIWFALLLPISFFWYGWAADKQVHYIVPIIGLIPFGIGIIGLWLPIQAYLVDAFQMYAASALAAFAVLRCTVAAFLPLAGPQMYDKLGVGWGTSLLGFVALALIPIPTLLYRYGKWMRTRWPIELD